MLKLIKIKQFGNVLFGLSSNVTAERVLALNLKQIDLNIQKSIRKKKIIVSQSQRSIPKCIIFASFLEHPTTKNRKGVEKNFFSQMFLL